MYVRSPDDGDSLGFLSLSFSLLRENPSCGYFQVPKPEEAVFLCESGPISFHGQHGDWR